MSVSVQGLGLVRKEGKMLGLYRDSGKEDGTQYIILGYILGYTNHKAIHYIQGLYTGHIHHVLLFPTYQAPVR